MGGAEALPLMLLASAVLVGALSPSAVLTTSRARARSPSGPWTLPASDAHRFSSSRANGRSFSALRGSEDDDEEAPELSEDFRDFRARLIARTAGEGLTEGSDERAVEDGWAYETPLLEAGIVLLGGTEQDFGFGLRQQYFHKCVLLITQHDDDFTRGVIVNRPSRREVDGWRVWCGGDVEEGGVFRPADASPDPSARPPAMECLSAREVAGADSCAFVSKGLWTTSFPDAKRAVEAGSAAKEDFMCLCGYAGWAPEQLAGEVERRSWHVAATDGGTLVTSLLEADQDDAAPLDDGLGTWSDLMRKLEKTEAASKRLDFDDAMLRAWVDARLDAPRLDVGALVEATRRRSREDKALEAISVDGAIKPGAVLACQHVEGADFLLDRQYLHKALVQVIAVQQDLIIACALNRPTSRRVQLRVESGPERVKRVAFGGDVQVRSAAGGVVWLARGAVGDGKGERLPLGDAEDATHVVSPKDVVDGLGRDSFDLGKVLALSGVCAFRVPDAKRMLGQGHLVPVPPAAAPLAECWALHADAAPPESRVSDVWRAAYLAGAEASGLPPPATPAELDGGLADEALQKYLDVFLA